MNVGGGQPTGNPFAKQPPPPPPTSTNNNVSSPSAARVPPNIYNPLVHPPQQFSPPLITPPFSSSSSFPPTTYPPPHTYPPAPLTSTPSSTYPTPPSTRTYPPPPTTAFYATTTPSPPTTTVYPPTTTYTQPPSVHHPPPPTTTNPPPIPYGGNSNNDSNIYPSPQQQQGYTQSPAPPMNGAMTRGGPISPASVGPQQTSQQQAPAGPRIDPSQIPSPTALADGRLVQSRTQLGQCPPPAACQYVALDDGNTTSRFVRLSMYTFPFTEELHQISHIPFAMVVQPLAEVGTGEEPVPLVDFSSVGGPVRCRRCRAYINPFNVFVDGGRKFICKFCDCENDDGYFSPLEATGKRRDFSVRPELTKGSVDFVASSEYIQKQLGPIRYVFVVDVSQYSVSSGLLQSVLDTFRHVLNVLGDLSSRIAIITFDNTVHFWNLRSTLQQPQMMVVPDVANIFVPLGEDGFFLYQESKSVVDLLLDKLPSMFTTGVKSSPEAFSAAVQAASLFLEDTGGRIIVFTTGVPDSDLKRREDAKLMGTDKERILYAPRSPALKALATECAGRSTAIDLFVCSPAVTIDLVSLSCLPNITGGSLYHYVGFLAEKESDRLRADVVRTLTRPFGYDAIAKVRCSKGITVSEYLGNIRISSSNDVELAGIDCDKSFVVALKHDDKLEEKSEPALQFAMLYTTSSGERRIRVHNISVNCSSSLPNLFRGADLDAILNIYIRVVVRAIPNSTLNEVRNLIADKCVDVLASYRKYCASSTSPAQLILPESLKLLPVFILSLSKNTMLRAAIDVNPDDRAYFMTLFNSAGPAITTPFIYPRIYALHKLGPEFGIPDDEGRVILPTPLRLSADTLDTDGAYLLENGVDMFLWFGRSAPVTLVNDLQGALQHDQPVGDLGTRAHAIVSAIRSQRCKGAVMRVVRSRDMLESKLLTMLSEDRSSAGESNSYVDFLCTVHKHIQNKLS